MIATHKVMTSTANAMANAVLKSGNGAQVSGILSRLEKGIGFFTRKDWNANLSMKTFKELTAQGIMPAH